MEREPGANERAVADHLRTNLDDLDRRLDSYIARKAALDRMSLDLSTRTANCLANIGCLKIEDAASFTEKELLRFPNLGRKSLNEVKEKLAMRGLKLKDEPSPYMDPNNLARLVGRVHSTKAAHERAVNELTEFMEGMNA